MWQLESKRQLDLVVIGNAGDKRVGLFQEALVRLGLPAARLVEYLDLISGRVDLASMLKPESLVRIESPGRNFEVERALLALGAECEEPEGEGHYQRLSRREIEALHFEKGLVLPSRQWYLGYCALLARIAAVVRPERLFNLPADIRLMFDKRACHTLLASEGIVVPRSLGPVYSYEELLAKMREQRCAQVFVKLAHGSSASGVVAYRWQGERHQATTTAQMVFGTRGARLYNSRRLQVYTQQNVIARLIDTLCEQRIQVERWIPKASYAGRTFDVRVVTIAGQARHCIARLSHSPLTNLHLLNEREDAGQIRAHVGEQVWSRALIDCQRAASLLGSLYIGLDLLFDSSHQRHALIEMNAFGDLLPGLLYEDKDTYTAEVEAILARLQGDTLPLEQGVAHA